MDIKVTGRKMVVTEALRDYAEKKIGNSMKVMDIHPLSAEVVLHVEKNPAYSRPAVCEVTMRTKGHIVRVEEHEEDMYAAIDVAAAKVLRQLRKFKTRVVEHGVRTDTDTIRKGAPDAEPDFDALMDELSDDEIVRVKEMAFEPMSQDEALLQIDLLGHDFFAYTDEDTHKVCVLYRRNDGGYGLLKQTN
jgi:putative sigma-54 modulation protein